MWTFSKWLTLIIILFSSQTTICKIQNFGLPDTSWHRLKGDNPIFEEDIEQSHVRSTEKNVVFQSLERAIKWTLNKRNHDWGWGQETPYTVLSLALANHTWFSRRNFESELVKKQFKFELLLRLWKQKANPVSKGQIALYVMGLVILCEDPRTFYGKDLVTMLENQENKVTFELAFSSLSSCVAGKHFRKSQIRRLLKVMKQMEHIRSIDTLSVAILALHCIERQQKHDSIDEYLLEATEVLLTQQSSDGSFGGNLHSTAIALQAMIASGFGTSWNATRGQQYVMSHQLRDGSFGSLFDTNAVLPLLAGKTLLNVQDTHCREEILHSSFDVDDWKVPDKEEDIVEWPSTHDLLPLANATAIPTAPQQMINVTYIIWFGSNATESYSLTLSVPSGTHFLDIMKTAARMDPHFEFSASKWPNGYYIHTQSERKIQQPRHWIWPYYRLREPPIRETKPSNKNVITQGVEDFAPRDGDYILFWYHQI